MGIAGCANALGASATQEVSAGNVPEIRAPKLYPREYDLVIIGGGPAGFGAAMCSASYGLKTLVIEKCGSPGGNMTNAFMCGLNPEAGFIKYGSPLEAELRKRLKQEGTLFDSFKMYPKLKGNPLVHGGGRTMTSSDMASYVMNQMMEESGVDFLYCTLFVDAQVKDRIITHAIVENASGRQAIKAKVFVDATGCNGVVAARAGVPYISAGSQDKETMERCKDPEMGIPVPGGLMWKMCGVDFEQLFAYQETGDRKLEKKIAEARKNGDIPKDLYRPRPRAYAFSYKGHTELDMDALGGTEMLVWEDIPYEWKLNTCVNGDDESRANVEMRKLIVAEWKFLKKYVPGFENTWISAIAPMVGIREGRHPVGEHMISYEDIINDRKFDDVALRRTQGDPHSSKRHTIDVPYRSFLPKKIDNLLLSGDSLSQTYECRVNFLKDIEWSMRSGELAGEAASLSVMQGITPKKLKWSRASSRVKLHSGK